MRQNRLRRCEQSEHVDVKLAPDLLRRPCLERPIGAVASVIHECIDTPESGEAGINGRPNGRSILSIDARDQRPFELRELVLWRGRPHRRDDIPAFQLKVLP